MSSVLAAPRLEPADLEQVAVMSEPGCHAAHPGVSCQRTAPGGYCLPPRCYCGGCPWFLSIDRMPTYTPDRYTAFDRAAVLSSTGRRTNLAEYRAAQKGRQA